MLPSNAEALSVWGIVTGISKLNTWLSQPGGWIFANSISKWGNLTSVMPGTGPPAKNSEAQEGTMVGNPVIDDLFQTIISQIERFYIDTSY